MWLPLKYSFHRNKSVADIQAGKYDNSLRLGIADSQRGATAPMWTTPKGALIIPPPSGKKPDLDYPLFKFSALCYYYAESLVDLLRNEKGPDASVPIGVVNTAVGGSMIEEWMTNSTTSQCTNHTSAANNQMLWDSNVVPYLDMTVKGWLYHQVGVLFYSPSAATVFSTLQLQHFCSPSSKCSVLRSPSAATAFSTLQV
jgi:hypothetical protein